MSHLTVGVIVPKFICYEQQDFPANPKLNEDAINMWLASIMAPYFEGLVVGPYDRECYCVGNAAHRAMNGYVTEVAGDFPTIRSAYWALPEEEQTEERWKEMIAPFEAAEKKCKAEHADDFKVAEADCNKCHGTGLYKSNYNPKSEWDWYVVGGRWDGDMVGNPQESENGFNFGSQHHTTKNNIIAVEDLIKRFEEDPEKLYTFFAIVTPDGQWHESGKMGWWGIVRDEKDVNDWRECVKSAYLAHRDYYIVSIDAHI